MSNPDQIATRLQSDVQAELERREWAEAGDNVMAEYVCVLLANGNPRDRVQEEMDDLVGSDFDPSFLDWLFARRAALLEESNATSAPAPSSKVAPAASEAPAPSAASRMFASAVEGTKRKAETEPQEPSSRRRLPDGPLGAPTGPRSMRDRELLPDRPHDRRDDRTHDRRDSGRSLMDRLGPHGGPRGLPMRPGMGMGMGMNGRGPVNGRGPMNGGPMPGGPGFQRPPFGNPGMMMPGQEQMMMQMMAMQANMAQMAQQMANMSDNTGLQRPVRPTRGTPTKPPFGGKASAPSSASKNTGAIPDKPSSTQLCKFGVGCTNARCTYSHPSPVANEKSGMVLSEEACEAGKNCKDPECTKSHVSPAAVNGGAGAGPSRILCKFQNCTNPTCQFRHEDAEGNFIPPPALSAASAPNASQQGESRAEDVEVVVKSGLDMALDDSSTERPCRYGERCTRADCKFTHPASRPIPRAGKAAVRGRPTRPAAPVEGMPGGMTPSRKFAAPVAESKLNPAAGEFKPAGEAEAEIDVSM